MSKYQDIQVLPLVLILTTYNYMTQNPQYQLFLGWLGLDVTACQHLLTLMATMKAILNKFHKCIIDWKTNNTMKAHNK